ncbi:MAG: hypothetical protein OXG37_14330 [Actinomycetia bacterium]|nr:hypothetical protein [Actinomycetes bacterium]
MKARPRITAPLLIGALGALAIVIASGVVGWLVIDNVEAQNQSGGDAELLADIAAANKLSVALASAASVATNSRMTPESIADGRAAIASNEAQLAERLSSLEERGYDDRAERIGQQVDLLTGNMSQIEEERPALLEAILAGERSWQQLLFSTNQKLLPAISSSLDDQFYYAMTGRSDFRNAESGATGTLSKDEYFRYWHLATLLEWTFSAHRSLLAANLSSQDDPTRLANNEESFDTAAQRMGHSIAYLAENGGPDLNPEVIPLANRLLAAGAGEDSALEAMRLRASMVARERELIEANRRILAGLQSEVDGLVAEIRQSSAAAADRHKQAVSNGRIIILAIAIVGVVGTLVVASYSGFKSRRRISASLAVCSLGVLAIVIASGAAGWLIIDNLEAESRGGGDVEVLAAAAEVTRNSGALASTASVASNARMTPDSIAETRTAIASNEAELAGRLTALEGQGYDGSVERIGQQISLLAANASRIEDERPALLEAILVGERNWQAFSLSTNYELLPAIGSSLDNQFYYMMTGRSDFRDGNPPGFARLSEEEFLRYWHLATLMESVSRGYQTLDFANRLTIPALTARVEETFDTAAQRMERSIEYLAENGGPELNPEVIPLANRLLAAGAGENSALDAMKLRTSMVAQERKLIGANRQIMAGLQGEVDGLVAEARQSLTAASARYGQAASNGRITILVIAVIGIVGTLLVAGYNSVRSSPS